MGDALIRQAAVEPPLTQKNAAGRFVYVPPEVYPEQDAAGWVAKILSVHQGTGVAMLQFKDKKERFGFATAALKFKPLN